MRETVEEKARRLLSTRCVRVDRVDLQGVHARVVGDTGIRDVTFDKHWRCTCPAIGPCSHAIAASRVVHR